VEKGTSLGKLVNCYFSGYDDPLKYQPGIPIWYTLY